MSLDDDDNMSVDRIQQVLQRPILKRRKNDESSALKFSRVMWDERDEVFNRRLARQSFIRKQHRFKAYEDYKKSKHSKKRSRGACNMELEDLAEEFYRDGLIDREALTFVDVATLLADMNSSMVILRLLTEEFFKQLEGGNYLSALNTFFVGVWSHTRSTAAGHATYTTFYELMFNTGVLLIGKAIQMLDPEFPAANMFTVLSAQNPLRSNVVSMERHKLNMFMLHAFGDDANTTTLKGFLKANKAGGYGIVGAPADLTEGVAFSSLETGLPIRFTDLDQEIDTYDKWRKHVNSNLGAVAMFSGDNQPSCPVVRVTTDVGYVTNRTGTHEVFLNSTHIGALATIPEDAPVFTGVNPKKDMRKADVSTHVDLPAVQDKGMTMPVGLDDNGEESKLSEDGDVIFRESKGMIYHLCRLFMSEEQAELISKSKHITTITRILLIIPAAIATMISGVDFDIEKFIIWSQTIQCNITSPAGMLEAIMYAFKRLIPAIMSGNVWDLFSGSSGVELDWHQKSLLFVKKYGDAATITGTMAVDSPPEYEQDAYIRTRIVEAEELIEHGRKIINMTYDARVKITYSSIIVQLISSVQTLKTWIKNRSCRVEPVAIQIYGPPGVGKTTLSRLISHRVRNILGLSRGVYYKSQYDKYCSGYGMQDEVVIDDVGQNTQPAPEMAEMINRLMGMFPYYPPMAELSQKGTISMAPKLVIATSNFENMNSKIYMNSEDAFLRRFPIVVRMGKLNNIPHYELSMRTINPDGVMATDIVCRWTPDIDRFLDYVAYYVTTEYRRHIRDYETIRDFERRELQGIPTIPGLPELNVAPPLQLPQQPVLPEGVFMLTMKFIPFSLRYFLTSLCEEVFKRTLAYSFPLYFWSDASTFMPSVLAAYCDRGKVDFYSLFNFIAHFLLCLIPFTWAVFLHTMWNYYNKSEEGIFLEYCDVVLSYFTNFTVESTIFSSFPLWAVDYAPKFLLKYIVKKQLTLKPEEIKKEITLFDSMRFQAFLSSVPIVVAAFLTYYYFNPVNTVIKTGLYDEIPKEDEEKFAKLEARVQAPSKNLIISLPTTRPEPSLRNLPNLNQGADKDSILASILSCCHDIKVTIGTETMTGRCLISGVVVLTAKHLFKFNAKSGTVTFPSLNEKIITFPLSRVYAPENQDWAMLFLDTSVFPSMTRCLIKGNGESAYLSYGCQPPPGANLRICTKQGINCKILPGTPISDINLFYDSKTVSGDSGSPLILITDKYVTVIGVHSGTYRERNVSVGVTFTENFVKKAMTEAYVQTPQLVREGEVVVAGKTPLPLTYTIPPKSFAQHIVSVCPDGQFGHLQLLGYRQSNSGNPKSAVEGSLFFKEFEHLNKLRVPKLKSFELDGAWVNFYHSSFAIMANQSHLLNLQLLDFARDKIVKFYVDNCKTPFPKGPYSILECVMGSADKSMNPVNLSTASGFPYTGKKSRHVNGVPGVRVLPSNEIINRVNNIFDEMDEGCTPVQFFKFFPKDEPIKPSKEDAGLTRLVSVGQLPMSLTQRSLLGPIYSWYKDHREIFPAAVGINASSPEWDKMAKYMMDWDEPYSMYAGDFKAFDKHMNFMATAAQIPYELAKHFKWDDIHLQRLKQVCLGYGMSMIEFESVVFLSLCGGNSGQGYTTETNCPYVELLKMMSWIIAVSIHFYNGDLQAAMDNYDKHDYHKHRKTKVFGDDNLDSQKKSVDVYYGPEMQQKTMGMLGMLMTDAEDKSKPPQISTISQVTFLKRSFRFDEEIGQWMAPLDYSSITKMMTWRTAGAIDSYTHANIVYEEAHRHMFLHGRKAFDDFHASYSFLVERYKLYAKVKTYDEYKEDYFLKYEAGLPFTCAYTSKCEEPPHQSLNRKTKRADNTNSAQGANLLKSAKR